MRTTTTKTRTKATRWLLSAAVAGAALFGSTHEAQAQEILVTGPLAGAPAVRHLRLYRQGRFEVSPAVTFSLLDQYQRTIFFGARLNYNFTDWLGVGVFGSYGGVKIPTALSDHVQKVNAQRRAENAKFKQANNGAELVDQRLVDTNLGPDFKDQLGTMDWILAPQLTVTPFRGKLALFKNIFVDTDLYFFAGPAFIGVQERADCPANSCKGKYDRASRVAIAPTFGLGFTFYVNKWNAIGFEYRGLPFSRNTGGFDTRGGGKDKNFPDNAISGQDRQFQFNQMLTISYNFYFPMQYRVSE